MFISFQSEILPSSCKLIGYSWLINHLHITLPLRQLCCVSEKRIAAQTIVKGNWLIFDAQLMVEETAYTQLEFAIKHEYLDLLVLKKILEIFPKDDLITNIQHNPKRILSKKIWFLYEFLLKIELPLEDLPVGKYDDLLNEEK